MLTCFLEHAYIYAEMGLLASTTFPRHACTQVFASVAMQLAWFLLKDLPPLGRIVMINIAHSRNFSV